MAKISDLHAKVEGLDAVREAFESLAEAVSNINISFEPERREEDVDQSR